MQIFRGTVGRHSCSRSTIAVLAAVLAGLVTTGRTHSASPQVSVKIKLAGKELQRSSQGGVANGGGGGSPRISSRRSSSGTTRAPRRASSLRARTRPRSQPPGPERDARQLERGDARPVRRRRPRLPRLLLELQRRRGPRHRARSPALAIGKRRRRLRRRRRRRRLALDDRRRQLAADRRQAAVAVVGRPRRSTPAGALWYGTGEANTGGTSYVGSGVYRLANPATRHVLAASDRVGGTELESTTIYHLRFARRHASTPRRCAASTRIGQRLRRTPWKLLFAPNPTTCRAASNAGAQNAAYKNIVNDIAVDPKNAQPPDRRGRLARR